MPYQYAGLGGTVTDVASAAVNVATDPCLGQVAALVNTLHALQGPSAMGATTPAKGIGLCAAVTPLRMAVWVKQRPWALPIGGLAIVGGLLGLGYLLGKERGR